MEKITTSVRLPEHLEKKIKERMERLCISKNAVIITLLEEYFTSHDMLNKMSELQELAKKIENKK